MRDATLILKAATEGLGLVAEDSPAAEKFREIAKRALDLDARTGRRDPSKRGKKGPAKK